MPLRGAAVPVPGGGRGGGWGTPPGAVTWGALPLPPPAPALSPIIKAVGGAAEGAELR